MGRKRIIRIGIAVLALGLMVYALRWQVLRVGIAGYQRIRGIRTVEERVGQYGQRARARLMPHFESIGISYPPHRITIIGLKDEKMMEVWVADESGEWKLLRDYPVLRASGKIGPKLRQGDRQVPEGIYRIESLNPNSLYHLSLRINYPNEFDRLIAENEGRTNLGGDIMIHGKSGSVGCLAMGDPASEELFVLAAETGIENIRVIISPVDFRTRSLPGDVPELPEWTDELYDMIRSELAAFDRMNMADSQDNMD